MARIVVAMRPGELGHLYCSFALMNGVKRFGHEVTYLAPSSEEALIRARGFAFRPLQMRPEKADFACDLFVADQTLPTAAAQALYHGYRCVSLSTTLPPSQEYPPSWSARIPTGSTSCRATRTVESLIDNLLVKPSRVWGEIRASGGNLWSYRLPGMARDKRLVAALGRLKSLVTLVACPAELQFQRPVAREGQSRSNYIYIDPCVDQARGTEAFDCDWYRNGSVRICASLGSSGTALGTRVSRLLLQTMRRRSDWSMVLATSGAAPGGDLGTIPDNVHLADSIPQLAVLRDSDLMITHCGLNSVKESICAGVPMVGVPIRRDQPSVGARIRHHRLGAVTDPRRLDSRRLESVIEHALESSEYRENVRNMQRGFAKASEAQTGARVIHEILRRLSPA